MHERFGVVATAPLVPAVVPPGVQRGGRRVMPSVPRPLADVLVIELPEGADPERAARAYAKLDGVVWAEADGTYRASFVPDDPYFDSSGAWGQPYRDLWGLQAIDATSAWDVTRGAGTVVAVSDTGVDGAHPDLAGRIWSNPGEVAGNGIDDDGNGFVDDVSGWDFVNGDAFPFDDHGHGTHVGGTIAAAADNGLGIVGVAPQAVLMPVKGLNAFGSGSHIDLARTIQYATDNGADVINASWGGGGFSEVVAEAVASAHAAGVVFVASAGNDAADVLAANVCPACLPDAITVAASTYDDQIATFSNHGAKIDVAAPGGGDGWSVTAPYPGASILSLRSSGSRFDRALDVGSDLLRLAGTSMAAPHVSGAAALVLALHPDYGPEEVRQLLRATADDRGLPGVDGAFGYGRLNVGRALRREHPLAVRIFAPVTGSVVNDVTDVVATVDGDGFASYVLQLGAGSAPTTWSTLAGPVTTPVQSGVVGTFDPMPLPDGVYMLRIVARTLTGEEYEDRAAAVVTHVAIVSPVSGDIVGVGGAPVEIRGNVGGVGFDHVTVDYRVMASDLVPSAWRSDGVVLVAGGTTAVDGTIATIDASAIGGPFSADFRVSVFYDDGRPPAVTEIDGVVADPTLRVGWRRRIPVDGFSRTPLREQPTLADLDGDGAMEILTAYGPRAYALKGDGTDAPGWPQPVAPSLPEFFYVANGAPAVGDLDGDGRPEVVASVRARSNREDDLALESIMAWHGDGTPVAGWPVTHLDAFIHSDAGTRATAVDPGIAVTDVDGDGRAEVVAEWRQSLHVLRGDGTDMAGFPRRILGDFFKKFDASFEGPPAVGDIDGDGRKEIVVVERRWYFAHDRTRQYLHVFHADGSEVAGWPRVVAKRVGITDPAPILADLDGDGTLDIATASDRPTTSSALGSNGKRMALLPRKIPIWLPNHAQFAGRQGVVSAGDVDGDGRADLLVPSGAVGVDVPFIDIVGDEHVTILRAGSIPGWSLRFLYQNESGFGLPGPPIVADLDGDGAQDVLASRGRCSAATGVYRCFTLYGFTAGDVLLPGYPKVTVAPASAATLPGSSSDSLAPAVGDVDGDRRDDLVLIDREGNLMIWTLPGAPGPRHHEWPMVRHDAGHTGALRQPPQ